MKIFNIPYSLKYNPHLDGLRGLSILLVLSFHFFPDYFGFGFVGVDIFFFLSGFLITSVIIVRLENGTFSFKEFYRNRARRLFPALILVLFFCLVIGYLFLFPEEYADLGKHIKTTAFYYENFRLIDEVGYWDKEALQKPLLHMWSLSVEEQFYIFWPLLTLVIFEIFTTIKARIYICILLFVAFYCTSIYISVECLEKSFYHTLARAWELSFGGVLAVLVCYKREVLKQFLIKIQKILFFLIPLLLLYILIFCNIKSYSPLKLVILLFIVSIIVAKVNFFQDLILRNKFLVFIGLISYSLYIWHYIILSFLHIFGYDSNLLIKIVALLFIFLTSILSFYFVEIPFRKNESYFWATFLTIILAFIGLIGHFIYTNKGMPNRAIVQLNGNIDFSRESPKDKNCLSVVKDILNRNPSFNYCRSTTNDKKKIEVAILGDSHGFILYEGLHKILKKEGIDAIVLANSACPPYINGFMGRNLGEVKKCENKIKEIYKVLRSLTNIKLIIFTSRLAIYATEKGFGDIEKNYTKRPHKFKEFYEHQVNYDSYKLFLIKIDKTFEFFSKQNIPVLFVLDNPELGFSPKKCLKRLFLPLPDSCKLRYKAYLQRQGEIKKDITYLTSKYKNILLFDLANVLCDSKICYVFKNNQTLYTDDDHLSKHGSYVVASEMFNLIMKLKRK